jgi:hypothetical protein
VHLRKVRSPVVLGAVSVFVALTACAGDNASPKPSFVVEGRKPVAWKLVGPQPAAADTKITVEAAWRDCTGGSEPEDPQPAVAYFEDTISVTIWAIPPAGKNFTCQGNPSIPVTIDLSEPVGHRTIVQGPEKPY